MSGVAVEDLLGLWSAELGETKARLSSLFLQGGTAGQAFLADKAYDADALIKTLEERGITPVIPSEAKRLTLRETGFILYRERTLSSVSSTRSKVSRNIHGQ